MSDQQAGWMKGLVEPVRVKPGSVVDLARDFPDVMIVLAAGT